MTTPIQVQTALQQAFPTAQISAADSACGHGSEHFTVRVITEEFLGLSLVERHRRVYGVLQTFLQQDMHALRIEAKTPAEVEG